MNQKYMLHYTSLARLIEILKTGRLPLTNPIFWKDKNDAFSVAKSSSKAVGVMCFSMMEEESNLFWESYANDGIGICIVFNQEKLKKNLKNKFELKEVTYLHYGPKNHFLNEKNETFAISKKRDLAFIKNSVYSCERELRLVQFTDKIIARCGKIVSYLELEEKIDSYICEILLSPFLEEKQRRDVKLLLDSYLRKLNLNVTVSPSKITSDVKWRNAVRELKSFIKINKE